MSAESDLGSIFLFGLLALILLLIGWKRDFFSLPPEAKSWKFPILWIHVVLAFLIYFAVSSLLTPFLGKILQHILFEHPSPITPLSYASWINFINSGTIFLFLICFLFCIPSLVRKELSLRTDPKPHSFWGDIRFACLGWIFSFPLVLFINQLFDWIVANLFHIQQIPEQLAVYFLKMTFGHPLYLSFAIITIVIFAPLVEEILFRGFLQSFIRKHLGNYQAIVITSLLFSFFHYSPEQGIANMTIIASLFVFSLFLGFIYEKRGSLLAPMTLHALFNAVNVCNLYFLGGIPKGPL